MPDSSKKEQVRSMSAEGPDHRPESYRSTMHTDSPLVGIRVPWLPPPKTPGHATNVTRGLSSRPDKGGEGGIRTHDQELMSFLSLRTRDFGVSGQFLGQDRLVRPNSPLVPSFLVTLPWSGLLLLPSVRIQRVPDLPDSLGERGTPPRGIKDLWRPTCELDSRPVIQRQSSTAYTSGRS